MPRPTGSTAVATRPDDEPKPIVAIRQALTVRADDLLKVLPPGMDPSRFIRVSLSAISQNADLLKCTPVSIVRAIMEAAEIGLEPTGSLNRAWIVPYGQEATLVIGYQGLQDLARDSGKITAIWSRLVYKGDEFEEVEGSERRLVHRPAHKTEDPLEIEFAYAMAQYLDGTLDWEVMSKTQVDLIRSRSRGKNGKGWVDSYGQMARKTAVRRLANSLPLTPRAILGISRDDEHEFGGPAPVVQNAGNVRVRQMLAAKGVIPPADAEISTESDDDPGPAASSTPDVSATGQTQTDGQAANGEASEVCGAQSDPEMGDIETCVAAPDHAEKFHVGASGSRWPVVGPKT